MKTTRLFFAFAATCLALSSAARAQLQSFSTHANYNNSTNAFADFSGTLYQTFTNVSAVHSMTFNFFTSSSTSGSTFSATFGEWNGSSFEAGTTVSFSNFNVSASSSWGAPQSIGNFTGISFTQSFDFTTLAGPLIDPTYGYLTDFTKTYAMMLVDQNGSTSISLGVNNFGGGSTFPFGATNTGSGDYVFSQISVAPGNQNLTPVPEASTVAAIAGGVLVAGLVIVRTRQRRQLAAAGLPAPAAS